MRADQQRVRSLLAEAITILCKNTLAYTSEFTIEGLLGITLDNDEVFLVNIKENVGATSDTIMPTALPPDLGMSEQMAPPPPSARPIPTSRPIPARSPFLPRRPTFGLRGRGKIRGKHPVRPPSRTVHDSAEKRRATHDSEDVVETKQRRTSEDETDTKETDADEETEADRTTNNQNADPLTSLDFGDMMQQYEDSEDTIPEEHDKDKNHEDGSDSNGAIVIKPDPDKDSSNPAQEDEDVYIENSGGMFPHNTSGSVFPTGAVAVPVSEQYVDSMGSFSGWGQQVGATPSPSSLTPKRSGPGRPSAAAGSSQGSPSQVALRWNCSYCGGTFTWKQSLKRHIETIHQRSRMFRCKICNKMGNDRGNMRAHIGRIHRHIINRNRYIEEWKQQ